MGDAERIAQGQLVLGKRARFIGAKYVHARQFLDRNQSGHDRLLLCKQARANGHRDREHRRHGHRNRRYSQYQGELQGREYRIAPINCDGDDCRYQNSREDDQIITDLENGALKMADGFRALHQLRRFAKIGVGAGGIDHGGDFTLANDRSGKYCFTGFAGGGKRFSRQGRLIHLDRVAVQQARIRWHNVAQPHANNVARDQFTRRRVDPLPVAFHPGLDRQCGL